METMTSNNIIVISTNHHNGLGIIRSLGEAGYNVYLLVLSERKSFITKSKYISKYWYVKDDFEVIELLKKEFISQKFKHIIFPADDISTSIIDRNVSLLEGKFIIPNINLKDNAILHKMNKLEMNKLAEDFGFLVPKSITVNLRNNHKKIEELVYNLNIDYPIIVKPVQSISGSKSDISIVTDNHMLTSSLTDLKKIYSEVLIQEYIDKKGELGVQGLVTPISKEVIIPGVIEKVRQSEFAPGSTTYAKLVKKNPLINISKIKEFIEVLGYIGVFDMEFIFTNEKVYFIELNYRNGAYGYAFTRAGINIPLLWYYDAINKDISVYNKDIKKEITLLNEFADLKNVTAGNVNLFIWLIEFIRNDAYLILNKKDLKPFIYKFLYR